MKKFAKLVAVFAALFLTLYCFVACSNGADTNGGGFEGGGGSGDDGKGDQETASSPAVVSKSIAGYTTAETKTQAGNNVSDMLYLLEDGKFELYKNLSCDGYSDFALFAKGSYSGDILVDGKLTFSIKEEMDTTSLSEEEKMMLGLSSSSAKSARSVLAARSEIDDLISKLKSLIKKLESIQRKDVSGEGKSLQIKSEERDDGLKSLKFTGTDGQEQNAMASASGLKINLDGFLLTGNPCHSVNEDGTWNWFSTKAEGAIPLEKTSDGKYACTFVTNDNDTVIQLILENWKSQYGLLSVDLGNCVTPDGVRITNDTEVVNVGHEEWQHPENIAIAGIEKGRKYDIIFDTAKTPGKICIELKRHVITTLDGYMLSGSMNAYQNPDKPGEMLWPFDEKSGALPLKNADDNKWTCSFKLNEGWNGFLLIKDGWTYEIGRSQLSSTADKVFSWNREDDIIAFIDYEFDGTENATLTFTVRSDGLIDVDCDFIYDKAFELNGLYFVQDGNGKPTLITDDAQSFTLSAEDGSTQIHLLDKIVGNPPTGGTLEGGNYYYYDGGCCWFDGTDYYWFKSLLRYNGSNNKLPNGVSIDWYDYAMAILGLTKNQNYTLKFDTTSKKGYFSVIIE